MKYLPRAECHTDKEYVLASVRRRFVAFLLDWLLLIILYLSLIFVLSLFGVAPSKFNVHGVFDVELEIEKLHPVFLALLKLIFGLLPVIYFTLSFYFFGGQTPGKYLLRIRVLSLYHERIGLWHSIERSLGYFASALELGFGYLQAIWNPNRMSLHDKISETFVIQLPGGRKVISSEGVPVKP